MVAAALALAAAVGATTAAPVSAGSANAGRAGFLKTPSRAIYCDYHYGGTKPALRYVRCGFNGTLVPPERKPRAAAETSISSGTA